MRSPFSATPLDLEAARQLSLAVRTLADPARLQILNMLHRADGELALTELTSGLDRMKQPSASYHVSRLVAAGVVARRREGIFVYHRLTRAGVVRIAEVAEALHPGGES